MYFLPFGRSISTNSQRIALLAALIFYCNGLVATAYQSPPPPTMEDPTMGDTTTEDPIDSYSYPPYADFDWGQTGYNEFIFIGILANDYGIMASLDPSSVTIVDPPTHGTVQVDPVTGDVLYFPDGDHVGSDEFTYTVADTLGNVSNIAPVFVDVVNYAPQLTSLTVTEGAANMWTFAGQVTDEDPASVTIIFGGLLAGETVEVNADGSFEFAKYFGENQNGEVSAYAKDEFDAQSDTKYGEIYHY